MFKVLAGYLAWAVLGFDSPGSSWMFFDILWIVRKQKLYVRLLAARRVVLQQFRSEEEIELMSLFGIVQCTCKPFKVKVDKGVRWMPRHTVAMKDVPSCDKLRGAA